MTDERCPVCGEKVETELMLAHLRQTHPTDHWGAYSTKAIVANGQVVIGLGRRICYALAIWPHDAAPRSVIRAMLPERGRTTHTAHRHAKHHAQGKSSAGENRTSRQFQERLRQYELAGMIERGSTYIRIVDRDSLWGLATNGVVGERVEFLAIEKAIQPAREAVARAELEAAKRAALRDLQAVYDLMKANAGVWHGGKSNVRHVPHGWRGRPS